MQSSFRGTRNFVTLKNSPLSMIVLISSLLFLPALRAQTAPIDDPKMYTHPWMALNRFPLRLQPRGFDIREMYCAPSDTAEYNQKIGDPILAPGDK